MLVVLYRFGISVWSLGSWVRGVVVEWGLEFCCLGCGVWGVGCGVWGVGCGVWGVGVQGVGCGV